ncbi:DUF1120 domain-containing protein [Nocardia tengchongensis]|uniref:DUF1120 domain-containing protein n=1 Tax=Nocardia tengchongensis TaxID=2055889 RepID=UPI0036D06997
MTDEQATPNAKGPAPVTWTPPSPVEAETTPAPTSEINPDGIATLILRYTDGALVLSVEDGAPLPEALTIVDSTGTPVARYTPSPLPEGRASSVDLTVTGIITPSACTPTLTNGGIVDYGKTSARYSQLTVTCDAATLMALDPYS